VHKALLEFFNNADEKMRTVRIQFPPKKEEEERVNAASEKFLSALQLYDFSCSCERLFIVEHVFF
jgi:hypothetical protein